MSIVVLKIKNEEKGKFLLDFLRQIEFVEIEKEQFDIDEKTVDKEGFRDLFGLWKDSSVSIDTIRHQAWKER